MEKWFLDPKSISLIAGAAIQLVITVWSTRQTAQLVKDLVLWRLDVTPAMAKLETRVENNEKEIDRLRNLHENQKD